MSLQQRIGNFVASLGPRMGGLIGAVRQELGRVSWPSRKEVGTFTVLIILITIVLGLYLGLADLILTRVVGLLLRRS